MRVRLVASGLLIIGCSEAPRTMSPPSEPPPIPMEQPAPPPDHVPPVDVMLKNLSITSVAPNLASTVGRDRITIGGTGFDSRTEFTFAGVRAEIESVSETQAVVYAPPNPGGWGTPIVVAARRQTDGKRATNSNDPNSASRFAYYSSLTDYREGGIVYTQYGRPRIALFPDLNNDGKKDLALMQQDYGNYTSYLNSGLGEFQYYSNYGTACGIGTFDGITADFDKDNNADIAFTNSGSTVSYHLGNGTGSINSRANNCYGTGSGSHSVQALDFNGDNYLDLIVACHGSGYIGMFPNRLPVNGNNINNVFDQGQQYTINPQGNPIRAIPVDYNQDGKMDVVVANHNSGQRTLVWFDSSKLTQNGATPSGSAGTNPQSGVYGLECADFNGDKAPDCVVSNQALREVYIFLNKGGDMGFNDPTTMKIAYDAYTLRLEDVNLDGKVDLAVPSREAHSVAIYPGRGDGTFGDIKSADNRVLARASTFAMGCRYVWSVRFEDLDDDGRKEMAVVCEANDRGETGYGQLRVLRNVSQ